MIGDEAAPRKWSQGRSSRDQSTLPVDVSRQAVPSAPKWRIDAALFNGWRATGVAVELVAELRLGYREQQHVVSDLAAGSIDAHREPLLPVLGGSGHPDLIVPDHRRRPGLAVHGRLPGHVLIFDQPASRWPTKSHRPAAPETPASSRPLLLGRKMPGCRRTAARRNAWNFRRVDRAVGDWSAPLYPAAVRICSPAGPLVSR